MFKEVYLYKMGRYQKDFEYLFDDVKVIKYVVDLEEEVINDKYITIEELANNKPDNLMMIVCELYNEKTGQQLAQLNFKHKINVLWFEELGIYLKEDNIADSNVVSNRELFEFITYKESYDDEFCKYPFEYVNINALGSVFCCCPAFGYNLIGNTKSSELNDIWNSTCAKLIRLTIINKTFALCNRKNCPFLKKNPVRTDTRFDDFNVSPTPKEIYLSIDKSCNLHCRSCRLDFFKQNDSENEISELSKNKLMKSNWLINCNDLCIAGDGEVFFSSIYKEIIYSEEMRKRKGINILTNGNLMIKPYLDKLCDIYEELKIFVSLDAAKEETYEKLRCGGNFKNVMKNLEYLSYLHKENKVIYVELNFVIQRENYKEINDFIQLVKKLGFNGANFTILYNWGTYTNEEYGKLTMVDDKGIPNLELTEVLNEINSEDYKYISPTSFLYNYFKQI